MNLLDLGILVLLILIGLRGYYRGLFQELAVLAGVVGGVCIVSVDKQDHSIRSADELSALTEMPPLGVIARIETPFDLSRKRQRRRILLLATCCSLSLGILIFHFFYMDVWILVARLLRFSEKIS